ncbi:hypothetical protein WJX84_010189 [Apatococcus fuscideae]|uniref:Chlorophyll b reductase n=1 Tax=Apatococcus fuscideae TaxID=2026836 RepID=A0AAW1SXK4_9CHLO
MTSHGRFIILKRGTRSQFSALETSISSANADKYAEVNGWHKPVGLVLVSAHTLATTCHLSGAVVNPVWLPAVTGGAIGLLFAVLNRAGLRRFWRAPATPLNVVITGSSRGIGKAIAREFLRQGDRVFITSRNSSGLTKVMDELREELQDSLGDNVPVSGFGKCNVGSVNSVARLAAMAQREMGTVDVWVNNAGYSGTFQNFLDATPEQLTQVVGTNLGGSLLCMRAAMKLMAGQPKGGHIFTMDGAGADGQATPQYVAYGATKAGIRQLMRSLAAELRQPLAIGGAYPQPPTAGKLPAGRPGGVGIHTISPGMVLTNLLLEGSTFANRQVFNILCEQPETVAAFLVPRIRTVVARNEAQRYIRYLTVWSALTRFITAPLRAQRFFDADGEPVYGKESERITARASKRLAERVAVRSRSLALAYSSSLAASYLLILAHSLAVLPHAH